MIKKVSGAIIAVGALLLPTLSHAGICFIMSPIPAFLADFFDSACW